jgi:tetratricopeptide (TPR) repeat protein
VIRPILSLAAGFLFVAGASVHHAFERNVCALQQIREPERPCGVRGDAAGLSDSDLPPAFRSALFSGPPEAVRAFAPRVLSRPDRIGEALVSRKATRRAARDDATGGARLLEMIAASGSCDPLVLYATGHGFEELARPDRAEACYRRGLAEDGGSPRAPGRFYLAVLYAGQGQWSSVVDTLAVDLRDAPEPQAIGVKPCGLCRTADWPAAFLLLGTAYERTGLTGQAADTYRRFLLARPGSRDWQDNRALMSLAAIEASHGALAEAVQHFGRALDLTFGYPASFRVQYQDNTWR